MCAALRAFFAQKPLRLAGCTVGTKAWDNGELSTFLTNASIDETMEHVTAPITNTVVIKRDVPEHYLKKGDLGAVVEVYEPDSPYIYMTFPRH